MNASLNGKIVLVTGGGGGLGSAIALALKNAGAQVVVHYNLTKPLAGADAIVAADLREKGFEIALLDQAKAEIGDIDVLVNCAASQEAAALCDMSEQGFSDMQALNVTAIFALSTEFARRLKPGTAKRAAIINISSIEATRPAKYHGAYATSKAALEMLTKSMALEYGPSGLRVNAIAPGLVARPGIEKAWPEGVARWQENCPLGRMAQPQEIAQGVVFLASDSAGFINGTVLTIDGGMGVVPGW